MLFLFEYATCSGEHLPESIAVEGLAMFKALSQDIRFYSFISEYFSEYFPRLKITEDFKSEFENALEMCDSALIVAPESDNILFELTKKIEDYGVENLGCSSKAVEICSDKYTTMEFIRGKKPKTHIHKGATPLDFPVVAKPRFGEGGWDVRIITSEEELDGVPEGYIIQEYVPGKPCSASLIVDEDIKVVSLQEQILKGFEFAGCKIPLNVENQREIEDVIIESIAGIPGLKGFVGVDFILVDSPVIIEVNPRVTTPVVGFKKAYNLSFWDILSGKLPKQKRSVVVRKATGNYKNAFARAGKYAVVVE